MTTCFSIFERGYQSPCLTGKIMVPLSKNKLQLRPCYSRTNLGSLSDRRQILLCSGASLIAVLSVNYNFFAPLPTEAEGEHQKDEVAEDDKGVLDTFKTFFDPNEKTKTGKVLPKAFLKSAREVVKTLRESLKEDAKDIAKFRKTADAAKESIREYLNGWKGEPAVKSEESYVALIKAIRSIASFYSKAGPFAPLPEEIKSSILDDLDTADANL